MKALTARVLLILILLIPIMSNSQAQSKKERADLRVWVKLDEKWGLIDGNEQWIVEPYYANCPSVINDLAIVTFPEDSVKGEKELRKHAVINDKGETILEFDAIDAEFLETFETIVFETGTGKGCMNLKGEVLVEPVYEAVREDHADRTRFFVQLKEKWGMVDVIKGLTIPVVYNGIETAYINRYIVEQNNQFGLVNHLNEYIISPAYGYMRPDFNSSSPYFDQCVNERVWGYENHVGSLLALEDGRELISTKMTVMPLVTDRSNWIPYIDKKMKGYITPEGKIVFSLDSSYASLSYFSNNRAVFSKKVNYNIPQSAFPYQAFGVIDSAGKEVVEAQYGFIQPFSNQMAHVSHKGKHGFMDVEGEIVIPLEYDLAWEFDANGMAQVKKGGKLGFVDKAGKDIIPIQYVNADVYGDVYVMEDENSMLSIFNGRGELIFTTKFEDVRRYFNVKYNYNSCN